MNTELSFEHLYDDKWGHIQKAMNRWEKPTIIFPLGFVPEVGKKYNCNMFRTSATFIYNNVAYNVSSAHLENCAGITEEIDYKFRKRPLVKTTMESAFKNAEKVKLCLTITK